MAEARQLLVIVGARGLTEQGEGQVHQLLSGHFESMPEDSVVLTGGAPGPDTWACEAAEGYGLRWVVYLRDGRRLDSTDDGASERRWSRNSVDTRGHEQALVEAATKARSAGWGVRVLALFARGEGDDAVERFAGLARRAGLDVVNAAVEG